MDRSSLSEQQRAIFSATSNTSRHQISILDTAPAGLLKPQLEDSSSFGNTFKAAGAVPFTWEAVPGKPKSAIQSSSSPSLQPPPSRNSSQRSSPASLSPVSVMASKSNEQRSSPVSILEGFGVSSPDSSSSPGFVSQLESPLSSQFKKQLSLEIWDRSMRESSSSSKLSFLKQIFLGCWQSPKSRESSIEDRYYHDPQQVIHRQQLVYGQQESHSIPAAKAAAADFEGAFLHSGELERFREEYSAAEYGAEDAAELGAFHLDEEEEQEVHAVNHGDFATLPVSAAFVFSKPALKKARVPHNKRVRFLIEDYSSNEEDGEDDVCEGGSSSENEGFQRPARVIIRRRRSKLPSLDLSSSSSSPSANENVESTSSSLDDDLEQASPDLQPMEMFR